MDEEGLRDTGRKGIKVGRPLDLSYADVCARMDALRACIDQDPHHIRNCLQRAVPTYHPQNLPAEYLDTLPELQTEADERALRRA